MSTAGATRNALYVRIGLQCLCIALLVGLASGYFLFTQTRHHAAQSVVQVIEATQRDYARHLHLLRDEALRTNATVAQRILRMLDGHPDSYGPLLTSILEVTHLDFFALFTATGDRAVFQWSRDADISTRAPSSMPTKVPPQIIEQCHVTEQMCGFEVLGEEQPARFILRHWGKASHGGKPVILMAGAYGSDFLTRYTQQIGTQGALWFRDRSTTQQWTSTAPGETVGMDGVAAYLPPGESPTQPWHVVPAGAEGTYALSFIPLHCPPGEAGCVSSHHYDLIVASYLDTRTFTATSQRVVHGCLLAAGIAIALSGLALLGWFWPISRRFQPLVTALRQWIPQEEYAQARDVLRPLRRNRWVADEISVLSTAALTLIDVLETNREESTFLLDTVGEINSQRDRDRAYIQHIFDTAPIAIIVHDGCAQAKIRNEFAESLPTEGSARLADWFGSCVNPTLVETQMAKLLRGEIGYYYHLTEVVEKGRSTMTLDWVHRRMPPIEPGGDVQILSIGVDAGDRQRESQRLAWLSFRDPLTLLRNRPALEAEIDHVLELAKRDLCPPCAVALFHLPALETEHHLDAAAGVFRDRLRAVDLCAHVADTTFAILLRAAEPDAVKTTLGEIQLRLTEFLGAKHLHTSCAILAATIPHTRAPTTGQEILASLQSHLRHHWPQMDIIGPADPWPQPMAAPRETGTDLSLRHVPFRIRPIYDLQTHVLSGLSVLAPPTWDHPTGGKHPGAYFGTVLRAVREYADAQGIPLVPVFYPLRGLGLIEDTSRVVTWVHEAAVAHHTPPELVQFFVDKAFVGPHYHQSSHLLQELARHGFRLAARDQDLMMVIGAATCASSVQSVFIDAAHFSQFQDADPGGQAFMRFVRSIEATLYAYNVNGMRTLGNVALHEIRFAAGSLFSGDAHTLTELSELPSKLRVDPQIFPGAPRQTGSELAAASADSPRQSPKARASN